MRPRFEPFLEPVKGDTYCIVTGSCRIPLYMPDRESAVMIDSGLKGDREGILALLEKERIRPAVLLTSHYHRDHVENHKVLAEQFGCQIFMSPFADAVCRDISTLRSGSYESFFMTMHRGGYYLCQADRIIGQEDNVVTAVGAEFRILRLPGHAQEHMGFVTPDGIAYLGDIILSPNVLHAVRIPYCTYCAGDLESKASVRDMNYDGYILAHNGLCDSIRNLAQENCDNMLEKIAMVESLCDRYMTLEQLAAKVMEHTHVDTSSLIKVFGAQRNVQVVAEYLVQTERLHLHARDGFVEYIKA